MLLWSFEQPCQHVLTVKDSSTSLVASDVRVDDDFRDLVEDGVAGHLGAFGGSKLRLLPHDPGHGPQDVGQGLLVVGSGR